jgi:hypothetical protein
MIPRAANNRGRIPDRMGRLHDHPERDCAKMLCLPAPAVNEPREVLLLRDNEPGLEEESPAPRDRTCDCSIR